MPLSGLGFGVNSSSSVLKPPRSVLGKPHRLRALGLEQLRLDLDHLLLMMKFFSGKGLLLLDRL